MIRTRVHERDTGAAALPRCQPRTPFRAPHPLPVPVSHTDGLGGHGRPAGTCVIVGLSRQCITAWRLHFLAMHVHGALDWDWLLPRGSKCDD